MTDPDAVQAIASAVSELGRRAVTIVPLRPQVRTARPRLAFRVETATGEILKARCMESEAAARNAVEMRRGLPDAFAAIVARVGAILIETWIEGRVLNALPPSDELIDQAGALLAELHTRPSAGGRSLPFAADLQGLKTATLSGLQRLSASGMLDLQSADLLGSAVERCAPQEAPHCLIHTDYCDENLVVDSAGRLFVIDNEHFRFGPAAMDLARTRYRWGWDAPDAPTWPWTRFAAAYEAAGGAPGDPFHEPFFRIAATVASADVRLQSRDPGLAVPLSRLDDLARTMARNGGPQP